MKNKFGFTLLEILAVIVIIGFILIAAIPAVSRLLTSNDKKEYERYLDIINEGAKVYADTRVDDLGGSGKTGCIEVDLNELVNNEYVKKFNDKKIVCEGNVRLDKVNGKLKVYTDIICTNKNNNKVTFENKEIESSGCVAYVPNEGEIENPAYILHEFNYTGTIQQLVIPLKGRYKLEVWGAQGGNVPNAIGGYGGYSYGEVDLNKDDIIYIVVGGQGDSNCINKTCNGGYNGGGNGYIDQNAQVSAGGGATHIALRTGLLSSLEEYKSDILIVAGAGGGSAQYPTNGKNELGTGGSGGGYKGNKGTFSAVYSQNYTLGVGGEQSEITYSNNKGEFGKGGSIVEKVYKKRGPGGGSGFYGGSSGQEMAGAGGGSGYIGNSKLINKGMYCYKCTGSTSIGTKTISTTSFNSNPVVNSAKKGNGYAKITMIG